MNQSSFHLHSFTYITTTMYMNVFFQWMLLLQLLPSLKKADLLPFGTLPHTVRRDDEGKWKKTPMMDHLYTQLTNKHTFVHTLNSTTMTTTTTATTNRRPSFLFTSIYRQPASCHYVNSLVQMTVVVYEALFNLPVNSSSWLIWALS